MTLGLAPSNSSLDLDALFVEVEAVLSVTPPENLVGAIGRLESAKAVALVRLLAQPPVPSSEGRLLDVREAAARLGVAPDFLYRRSSRLPFTVRVGRSLRFSSLGLDKYIAKCQGRGY